MFLGMAALFVRQFGHAILEPPCHDKEKALLGFNTRNKSIIVGGYILIPIVQMVQLWGYGFDSSASILFFRRIPMVSADTGGGMRTRPISHVGA